MNASEPAERARRSDYKASERRERATRPERAGEAARERACRGVRGAKPLGQKTTRRPAILSKAASAKPSSPGPSRARSDSRSGHKALTHTDLTQLHSTRECGSALYGLTLCLRSKTSSLVARSGRWTR